jgi:hypothetical protein
MCHSARLSRAAQQAARCAPVLTANRCLGCAGPCRRVGFPSLSAAGVCSVDGTKRGGRRSAETTPLLAGLYSTAQHQHSIMRRRTSRICWEPVQLTVAAEAVKVIAHVGNRLESTEQWTADVCVAKTRSSVFVYASF